MTILDTRTTLDTLPLTNLGDAVMFNDPYPRYAELRRTAPVSRVKDPIIVRGTGYMLTRHEDVADLFANRDGVFSSDTVRNGEAKALMRLMPESIRLLHDTMAFKDDPDHKRLKSLVHRAFTPKLMLGMADEISRISSDLITRMAVKSARYDGIDLVDDFALRLPLVVISSMLGIGEADEKRFHALARDHSKGMGAGIRGVVPMLLSSRKMMHFLDHLAAEKRLAPDDGLISGIIRANDGGERLSDREVLGMMLLLLLAGHDTTSSLISSSILALVNNPDQLQLLRDDPTLIETGIEELIRYTNPVATGNTRIAMADIEIAGVTIPKKSQVLGMIISANRDEEVFDNPEKLDLTRKSVRHLGFGGGAHYCLAHQLGRLEGKIAISQLLTRFEKFEVTVPQSELRYRGTPAMRGLRALPMRVS